MRSVLIRGEQVPPVNMAWRRETALPAAVSFPFEWRKIARRTAAIA